MEYTLHPKLKIKVYTKVKNYRRYFDNEYLKLSSYKTTGNFTIIKVSIARTMPRASRADWEKKIYFKKIFPQHFLIRNLDSNRVEVYFKDTLAGRLYAKNLTLFLQTNVLEPIIYYKLLQKNILLMHAAGVSDGKYGYLMPAHGGTGKTTLTLGLMGEGMEVLGDDLLLVDTGKGVVYPYLRPLHIFAYNVMTLRGAKLPIWIKIKIKIKDFLRVVLETLTRQEFLIATRVHASDLYDNFRAGKKVPIKKILFLRKSGENEIVDINKTNVNEIANTILKSEDLNKSLYELVLHPDEKLTAVRLELRVIKKLLGWVKYIEFINTRKLNFNDMRDFRKEIENI